METNTLKQYIEKNKNRFVTELSEWLTIPSVSANSIHQPDMLRAAEWACKQLITAGATKATVYPTQGHPIVYAEKIISSQLPTVLVYGHYDVQPADPIELWSSGPFDPVIKENKIYARGACDDKGQVFMHIKALEAMTANQTMHTNLKFLIEGEEEIGSPSLASFLKEQASLLKADVILISDTSMISLQQPSMDVGLRGLTYLELELTGPNRDLHSGVYGGAVANPIAILCNMLASLKDANNKITIPHFYDDVQSLTATERAELAQPNFDETLYKKDLNVTKLDGEQGYTTTERTGIRPTLEINGIWGGYTGQGAKTVLPSKAFAKLSCRLVPNQKNKQITNLVIAHLRNITPPSVTLHVTEHHGGDPYLTPTDSIEYRAAQQAIQKTLGISPIPVRGGGSIPIVPLFENVLGVKTIFLGFGLDSDNLHSPNEKFDLNNFYKGIETIPYFHQYYAELKQGILKQ